MQERNNQQILTFSFPLIKHALESELLTRILTKRSISARIIQRHWRSSSKHIPNHSPSSEYLKVFESNLFLLLHQIITIRASAVNLLISKIQDYIYRQKVKRLIQINKDYYTIIPSIQSSSYNIEIKILFNRKIEKLCQLSYCSLRKMYLFNVPRAMISQLRYKFCFIVNGSAIIDPRYPHKISGGQYYNVINFKDEQDKEFKLEMDYSRYKEQYYCCSKGISSSSDTASGSSSGSEEDESIIMPMKIIKKKSECLINNKARRGCLKIPKLKPIMKKMNSFKPNVSCKRVCFGKVEICGNDN